MGELPEEQQVRIIFSSTAFCEDDLLSGSSCCGGLAAAPDQAKQVVYPHSLGYCCKMYTHGGG